MNESCQAWIWSYLDGQLSPAEQVQFEDWLREAGEHREEFARAAMLHDRLRTILPAASGPRFWPSVSGPDANRGLPFRSSIQGPAQVAATVMVMVAAVLLGVFLWQGWGVAEVRASNVDLQRLNDWSRRLESRSFRLHVLEDRPQPEKGRKSREKVEPAPTPPPKRPLDGALLHARGENQFVLEQDDPVEGRFLTGCDGTVSWSISPQGAVRVSRDLDRFNRDVPGHEHQLPLNSLFSSLDRFEAAYSIQVFSENETDQSQATGAKSLLVATKKRGHRGPERIEVTYEANSGRILGMRIIQMPYGPRRLDLELRLEAEGNLEQPFFSYGTHHNGRGPIVNED